MDPTNESDTHMAAIVMKAYVLVDTDRLQDAHQALASNLTKAVFETSSLVLDFSIGFEKAVLIDEHYAEGSFVSQIPDARLLNTANSLERPC